MQIRQRRTVQETTGTTARIEEQLESHRHELEEEIGAFTIEGHFRDQVEIINDGGAVFIAYLDHPQHADARLQIMGSY
jgi:predicted NUDIX family NTP pyrophosphohydrolase